MGEGRRCVREEVGEGEVCEGRRWVRGGGV